MIASTDLPGDLAAVRPGDAGHGLDTQGGDLDRAIIPAIQTAPHRTRQKHCVRLAHQTAREVGERLHVAGGQDRAIGDSTTPQDAIRHTDRTNPANTGWVL